VSKSGISTLTSRRARISIAPFPASLLRVSLLDKAVDELFGDDDALSIGKLVPAIL